MANIDVCADGWPAHRRDEFTWVNSSDDTAVISQNGANTWPFTLPSPIDVSGRRSNGGPGRTDCSIRSDVPTPHTYSYIVNICPGVGPKTVVIT